MPENTRPASFYAKLPESVPEWWRENDIALWIRGNVFRVMQEYTIVRVSGINGDKECHVTIEGIPDQKRHRIKDLLQFTEIHQKNSPDQKTDEFFI